MSNPDPFPHLVLVQSAQDYRTHNFRRILNLLHKDFGTPHNASQSKHHSWRWTYRVKGGEITGLELWFRDPNDAMLAGLKYKGSLWNIA